MIFFQKVSQLVKIRASPKHPQSVTGFLIARIRVRGVKNPINKMAPQAAVFILIFRNRQIPIRNSAIESKKEKNRVLNPIQLMPKALK
jgi:hypothetical protein